MTNKEAIAILEEEKEFLYNGDNCYNSQAFDLAIKALVNAEEWDKLKLICANEGVIVYKVKEVKKNDRRNE